MTPTTHADQPSIHIRLNGEVVNGVEHSYHGLSAQVPAATGHHPAWLSILSSGLSQETYCLEAEKEGTTVGLLPLAFVRSLAFGKFLVSLPYVNSAGVLATSGAAASALITRAVRMADEMNVRYLELRHEREYPHPQLTEQLTSKVHMRLRLPSSPEELWKQLKPKVRNQIRKGEKQSLTVEWGRHELADAFYTVFSRNMRDLGTPVYGRRLFHSMLTCLPGASEICVVRLEQRPIAAAILVHGRELTEVPSASSLRQYNSTNANMLLYWHLLARAVNREQRLFDFGPCTLGSNTYRFKKQWGAEPFPAVWQYYVRRGTIGDVRPDNGQYERLINIWRKLPVGLTRLIGPRIVRGIP